MGRHTFEEPVTPTRPARPERSRGRRMLVPMALTGSSLVLTVAVVGVGQGLTSAAPSGAGGATTTRTALTPASYQATPAVSSHHRFRHGKYAKHTWRFGVRQHRPRPTTTPPSTAPATAPSTTTATTPPSSTTTTTTTSTPPSSTTTTTSTTTSTSTSTPPTSTTSGSFAQQVVDLTNAERAKVGCGALKVNSTLTSVAQAHSADMAANNYFDHTNKQGQDPFDRMKAAGYSFSYAGENIAAGQQTPAAVMTAWMNSSGHKANILNCNFKEIGVGYATGGSYGKYWTQDFGTPR